MNAGAAAAMQQQELDAGAAWLAVEVHAISLTPIMRGRLWTASVDMYGRGHNKHRALSSLSASANTSLGAVAALVALLEQEQRR